MPDVSREFFLYREISLPFAGDDDFAADQTDVSSNLLFYVPRDIESIKIRAVFLDVNTPTTGTCSMYVFEKAVPRDGSASYIVSRGTEKILAGPITLIEEVQEGMCGVRISDVVSGSGTKLRVYIGGFVSASDFK